MNISHVRPLFEVARGCLDAAEFFRKVGADRFISEKGRGKLTIIRHHIDEGLSTEITDDEFWRFLKVFYLISYDFDTVEGSSLSAILGMVRLARGEECDAQQAWHDLLNWVSTANPVAGTLACTNIPESVREAFGVGARVAQTDSIRRLKERAETVLFGTSREVGGCHIKRGDLLSELEGKAAASQFLLVVGERGSGKSALVSEWAQRRRDEGIPLFGVRTEDLDYPHLEAALGALRVAEPISDIADRLALLPRKILVLESVEKLLELDKTGAFGDLMQLLRRDPTWTVVASGRDYAYQQIAANFLNAFHASWESVYVPRFSAAELVALVARLPELAPLHANPALQTLIASPKIAELAYRAVRAGGSFSQNEGEEAFRDVVWRNLIAKESEQRNGIHLRRRTVFVEVAVARAKKMAFDVPAGSFDPTAVQALCQDNLLACDARAARVRPTDDVLEDWALDEYIDGKFQDYSDDLQAFIEAVGGEPAMRRAFRLWLHRKLRSDDDPEGNASRFVRDAVRSHATPANWRDEVICAVLQGENVQAFLDSLETDLLGQEGELLKRFCFQLRIACQEPDSELMSMLDVEERERPVLAPAFLRPRGACWPAMIRFLFRNLHRIGKDMVPHLTPLLTAWKSQIHIDRPLPEAAREAGLLADHLLDFIKDEYRRDKEQDALLGVMIAVVSAIETEFRAMVSRDILGPRSESADGRPAYVENFMRKAIAGMEGIPLCKHCPDLVISIGKHWWFPQKRRRHWASSERVDRAFGLREHVSMDGLNPPSGYKGAFWQLLKWHWEEGLSFILDVCNQTAAHYAQSGLDAPSGMGLFDAYDQDVAEVDVILNDGTTVKQFCSHRLWSAYRDGVVVAPDVLQCALMALEDWLIALVENDVDMQVCFTDILKRSNSALTTAVLASIATGFPKKIGRAALPLLRTPEFFYFDTVRSLHEHGEHTLNWFGMDRDPMAKFYAEERRKAALRPWRRQHLENLAIELQLTPARDEVFEILDAYRAAPPSAPNDDTPGEVWGYRLHRMDVRGWKAEEDRENERIVFKPGELERDLADKRQAAIQDNALTERFMKLFLWAEKTYSGERLEDEYYSDFRHALDEAIELHEVLEAGQAAELLQMHGGGIVTTAAVCIRDHLDDMAEAQIEWATLQVFSAVRASLADTDLLSMHDKTNMDGTKAAAEALPGLAALADEDGGSLTALRTLIALTLTHPNESVRQAVARGIRNKMWQHDPPGAEACLRGAIEFSRLSMYYSRRETLRRARQEGASDLLHGGDEYREQRLADERERLVQGISEASAPPYEEQISLATHSAWHLLEPCLMIPIGAPTALLRGILVDILNLVLDVKSARMRHEWTADDLDTIPQELSIQFPKLLAEHLMAASVEDRRSILEAITARIEDALDFLPLFLSCLVDRAVTAQLIEDFWAMWTVMADALKPVARRGAGKPADRLYYGNEIRSLRTLMFGHTPWQDTSEEHKDMQPGRKPILDFCREAVVHPAVADYLARLLHHFPDLFMPDGLLLLADHQAKDEDGRILAGTNTVYYLEKVIQRVLIRQQPLGSRNLQVACLTLLDAMVETGSSAAHFMRERLVSRRIDR
jgi:hypothetical protein